MVACLALPPADAQQPPAQLDGGDVLQLTGTSTLLVGMSKRTNSEAVRQVQQHLPGHRVLGIPVSHGLHLKSAVTALDGSTLLFADNKAGWALSQELLKQQPDVKTGDGGSWQHVLVPDAICANVLLIGRHHVVMQSGFPRSEKLLEELCAAQSLQLHKLPAMTEFIKADAALTCCSIIITA
jgi:N-dimethylarginine dimethylaminohydrolase